MQRNMHFNWIVPNIEMTLTTHISMDATEPQSGLNTIKNLLFLFMCCIIFLNSCNHLPFHDPFYVVFLKAVTCWYLRNHTDLCPQHNPTTKRLKIHTYINCRYNVNVISIFYHITKIETERTIQATCCSNIFQENYMLANIYRQWRSQILH